MKTLRHLILILLSIMLMSCGTTHEIRRAVAVTAKIEHVQKKLNDNTAAYVDGIVRIEQSIPVAQQTNKDKLILRLANDTQDIVGLPTPSQRLDVMAILDKDKIQTVKLQVLEKESAIDITTIAGLKDQLSKINQKIVEDAAKDAAKLHSSLMWKLKVGGVVIVIAAILGAICYFFPPAIPFVVSVPFKVGAALLVIIRGFKNK